MSMRQDTVTDLNPRFESRERAIITASLSPNPGQEGYRFPVEYMKASISMEECMNVRQSTVTDLNP